MTNASPIDVAVNPNNSAQRYVLWGNGRIDNIGGAPSITDAPVLWYSRTDLPVGVAIHIINWNTGAGYILDYQGGFQALNGAPQITTGSPDPGYTNTNGLPYVDHRRYVDWSWDPAGNGQGYALDGYGQLWPFGGATAPPRTGPRWGSRVARKLAMQWTPAKRSVTLDIYGGLHGDFGQSSPLYGPYWKCWDAARDLVVTDWANGRGYVLDLFGGVHSFGGATRAFGFPYRVGADVARTLHVLSASNPAKFWQVWSGGQSYEWTSSTPPTVTAGGAAASPAATVITTTQPTLAWDYNDPQRDEQTAWEMLVFTQAVVSANTMSDPLKHASKAIAYVSGIDRTTRGVVLDYDFPNGSYRYYIRAKDSAEQWSAWSNRGWVQDVITPTTPTALKATLDVQNYKVNLAVTAAIEANSDYVLFEYSDPGGPWTPVRGAELVPAAATTRATDHDVPQAVMRSYRARSLSLDPRTIANPSTVVAVKMPSKGYVLSSTADPNLVLADLTVIDAPSWTRESKAGVFETLGDEYPTVISDGRPKARKTSLGLDVDSREEWDRLEAIVESDATLVLRDPFGEVIYCRLVGTWSREQQYRFPYPGENTVLRHNHKTTIPLVEVRPPRINFIFGSNPPLPEAP